MAVRGERAITAVTALVVALLALATGWQFSRLTEQQEPRTFYDSGVYFQIAERPISIELFALAKPPTVPLVYRAADRDAATIEAWQRPVCGACWLLLAIAAIAALRHVAVRGLAAIVMFGMALAPARLGWTAVALSESLDDSLLALAVAIVLAIVRTRGGVRTALSVALVPALVAWVFARDTNALAVVAAIACAGVVWWPELRTGHARWALLPLLLALIAALVDLTIGARRARREPLEFQTGWAPELTSRVAFPAVNNILLRVMPDADARAFYAERGLPIAQLEPFATPPRNDDFVHADPARAEAQAWIADNGTTTFLSWLVRDPGARASELWRARTMFVAPDVHRYMPNGWINGEAEHPVLGVVRRLTGNRWVLLGMCVLAPLALVRPRRDPRAAVALCLAVAALVAGAASFYGDALEPDRHCYGAAQLLVVALVVALLAQLDRLLDSRAPAARAPQ